MVKPRPVWQAYHRCMEIKKRDEAAPFVFAEFTLRELTPERFVEGSLAEVTVPLGADRPDRVNEKTHRIYVCLQGEIEFRINGGAHRIQTGDVMYVDTGDEYGFHNGGYEEGRLLLIRMPGPVVPENY